MNAISLEAARQRAERAQRWVDDYVPPPPVRMHFERDMPALLDELQQKRAEVDHLRSVRDAAFRWAGARRAVALSPVADHSLLEAWKATEDALNEAVLAAPEGEPEGSAS